MSAEQRKVIQERFLKAVKKLNLRFENAEIEEKTGYNSGIISEYLNSKKPVSKKFLRAFCESFNLNFEEIWNEKKEEVKTEDILQSLALELKSFRSYTKSVNENLRLLTISSKKADKKIDDIQKNHALTTRFLLQELAILKGKSISQIEKDWSKHMSAANS